MAPVIGIRTVRVSVKPYDVTQTVRLNGGNDDYCVLLTDTMAVIEKLHLTASSRSNIATVDPRGTSLDINDDSLAPSNLDGKHRYYRFNPAVGVTYDVSVREALDGVRAGRNPVRNGIRDVGAAGAERVHGAGEDVRVRPCVVERDRSVQIAGGAAGGVNGGAVQQRQLLTHVRCWITTAPYRAQRNPEFRSNRIRFSGAVPETPQEA